MIGHPWADASRLSAVTFRRFRFSGIRIARYRVIVMTLMGTMSAVAGIMALAFLQAADPSTGPGLELLVIASAIIGGTALSGGSGSIAGALLGALIIAVIRNGLVLVGLSAYWGMFVTGVVIIVAVAIDYFIERQYLEKLDAKNLDAGFSRGAYNFLFVGRLRIFR